MYYGVTKYVVLNVNGIETPFVFPNHFTHADLVIRRCEPISAGFVYVLDGEVSVRGRSESLNLDNRGEIDERLIAKAFNW
jgi:hypothetical protein